MEYSDRLEELKELIIEDDLPRDYIDLINNVKRELERVSVITSAEPAFLESKEELLGYASERAILIENSTVYFCGNYPPRLAEIK